MEFKRDCTKKLFEELCAAYPGCDGLWKYFTLLTEIPRPSYHTDAASKWCQEIGKLLGGEVKADELGNVCILIPATPGKEDVPGVVLQAHLDMVPTTDIEFDFLTQPINAFIENGWLTADHTTLGGDDGSGVAALLAIGEDKTIAHGQIELLFTVNEEVGLIGALGLKEGELLSKKAKYLVNVDSEEWGEITLSCAGAVDRMIEVPFHREAIPEDFEIYNMSLLGYKGGHSGIEIHLGRANAVKVAIEMLAENAAAIAGCEYRIISFHGGHAHNAIPSSCEVELALPKATAEKFIVAATNIFDLCSLKSASVEKTDIKKPTCTFTKLEKPSAEKALTFSSTRTLLQFGKMLHHGVFVMSEECPTLVESSESVAMLVLPADKDVAVGEIFARSSKNDALASFDKYFKAIAELYHGKIDARAKDSPGWPAEPNSKLCKTAGSVFKTLFNMEAKLVPIHAGLECGIIINKFPENKIEAISVGPTIRSPHTVDEKMELKSCVELYKFLAKLVEELAQ